MLISIYIEGKEYIVEDSQNLLEVCLSLGFDVPYFCWHPALGSVGSCRQCAVKQYRRINDDIKHDKMVGHIVMSCMTPIYDGMKISVYDRETREFRKNILELLMINHPHDCPVCEEGGNCHLQDMTIMTGQVYRRYRFTKRTHHNQYLGPFIKHEMNRCITCYRCIRYYKDYAGGKDLGVFGVHDNIYFGRIKDGMLESEFSGNLIEICPTGVFTDKTKSENYARKWDTIFSPSICHQCSIGCNIIIGERYGNLCRVENRYNVNINGYFLCDRGRFGCDYINKKDRPKNPLVKSSNNSWNVLNRQQAIESAVCSLKSTSKIIGIGSARASIESNFSLRQLVGPSNFYIGVSRSEQEQLFLILDILYNSGIYVPTLHEIESYDAILILGEDITQTGSRMALSIRQAIRKEVHKIAKMQGIFDWQSEAIINILKNFKYPLFITAIDTTKLDDVAMFTYYDSIQNQARFAFAIAHAIDHDAPSVNNLNVQLKQKVDLIAQKLMKARKPLIISGSNAGSKDLIASAFNIAHALKNHGNAVGINFIVSDVNSIGLAMIGREKNIEDACLEICSQESESVSLIVLENDLYRHINFNLVNKVLNKVDYLMVLDHQHSLLQDQANLVLSVTNFAESNGTVINYEGRAQRFFQLYDPQYYNKDVLILESWRWLYSISDLYRNRIEEKVLNIDYVIDSVVDNFPKMVGIRETAPDVSFRIHGQKISKAPHRYSGRTAMFSDFNVHEPCISKDMDTMFTFSMEGNHDVQSLHQQIAYAWAPGWNSPQAWNKFQKKIGGDLLCVSPGIRVLWENNFFIKSNDWFNVIPESFNIVNNRFLIVPYWHLLGSEEMSQKSQLVISCMPKPYVMMNPKDAMRLNLTDKMLLQFTCVDQMLCLPIKFSVHLPIGHIGLPLGFPHISIFLSGMYAQDIQGVVRK